MPKNINVTIQRYEKEEFSCLYKFILSLYFYQKSNRTKNAICVCNYKSILENKSNIDIDKALANP